MSQILVKVQLTMAPDGEFTYTGTYDNETSEVIRRSRRKYVSVAQFPPRSWQMKHSQYEFIFSTKPTPPLSLAQREQVIATVQIEETK